MIDTHCHLDDVAYNDDLDAVISRAKAVGVSRIVVPGIDANGISAVRKVCDTYVDYALPAIGLHPENIGDDYKEQMRKISDAVRQYDDWVAIGEIGLDYHFDRTYEREQREVFAQQLEMARQADLPVLIHSRDATADMEAMTAEAAKQGSRGVLHCFSGSYETACKYLDYGWKLGIGGVLTFKNSKLHEVLAKLPLESLLLETDGPYLAPVPHRGERNESSYIPIVVARLAQIYNTTTEQVERVTDCNARSLLGSRL